MAHKVSLSDKDLKELLKRKKNERDGKILRRLQSIHMKHKGSKNKEIAEILDVCIDTLTDWFYLYKELGFAGL